MFPFTGYSGFQTDIVYHVIFFTNQDYFPIGNHLGSIYLDFDRVPNVFALLVKVDDIVLCFTKDLRFDNSHKGVRKGEEQVLNFGWNMLSIVSKLIGER